MKFSKGQEVFVISLKQMGKIEKISKNSTYRIRVKTFVAEVPENDLRVPTKKDQKTQKEYNTLRKYPTYIKGRGATSKTKSIDLHGFTSEDAIRKVIEVLDEAIQTDIERLEIIHGIGTGTLKKAIHKFLSESGLVAEFKSDTVNPGVTWVYL